jgi:hypothetical protein
MIVEFEKNEEGIKSLAIYLSQLTKECIEYRVDNHHANCYEVIILGF